MRPRGIAVIGASRERDASALFGTGHALIAGARRDGWVSDVLRVGKALLASRANTRFISGVRIKARLCASTTRLVSQLGEDARHRRDLRPSMGASCSPRPPRRASSAPRTIAADATSRARVESCQTLRVTASAPAAAPITRNGTRTIAV